MKLQFDNAGLRMRLDEADWAALLREGQLGLTGPGALASWRLTLRLHAAEAALHVDGPTLDLAIPEADARALEARLPCRDGLDYTFTTEGGCCIAASVEVDVRDSRKQRPRSR